MVDRPLNVSEPIETGDAVDGREIPVITVEECRKHLESISVKIVEDILSDTCKKHKKNSITKDTLMDAAELLDQSVVWGLQRFRDETGSVDEIMEYATERLVLLELRAVFCNID